MIDGLLQPLGVVGHMRRRSGRDRVEVQVILGHIDPDEAWWALADLGDRTMRRFRHGFFPILHMRARVGRGTGALAQATVRAMFHGAGGDHANERPFRAFSIQARRIKPATDIFRALSIRRICATRRIYATFELKTLQVQGASISRRPTLRPLASPSQGPLRPSSLEHEPWRAAVLIGTRTVAIGKTQGGAFAADNAQRALTVAARIVTMEHYLCWSQ